MKIRKTPHNTYQFECRGCRQYHEFNDTWDFNNDFNNPTVSPSIKVTMPLGGNKGNWICHSFIKDGYIQYLNDCSHEWAGKTLELQSIPEYSIEGE